MPATLNDFVKARAIGALVRYHEHLGGRESDWDQVYVYATQEFRDADQTIIAALCRMAKAAKIAASVQASLPAGECLDPGCIPGERS